MAVKTGKKFLKLLLIISFIWVSGANAIAGIMTGELDKVEGTIDDTFIYTLTIEGSYQQNPQFPSIQGLDIRQGGYSQSFRSINGKSSKQTQFQFLLIPKKVGLYQIPAIELEVDGKNIQTLPLQFTVSEASGDTSDLPFFVEREISKKQTYVGEALVVTDRVYTRERLFEANLERENLPESFRQLEIGEEKRYTRQMNGFQYTVIEMQTLLVPTLSGTFEIPSIQLTAAYPDPRNPQRGSRLFDDIFGRTALIKKRSRSDQQSITVKALPVAGRSRNYSGLVGKFQVEATVDQRDIRVGETATMTIRVFGNGITEGMANPNLEFDNALKVYDEKPSSSDQVAVDQINGERIFKYALVPTRKGSIELGSLKIQIFNPEIEQYEDISSDLGKLEVTGDPLQPDNSSASENRSIKQPQSDQNNEDNESTEAIELLSEDIIGLHPVSKMMSNHQIDFKDWAFLSLISFSGFFFALYSWLRSRWLRSKDLRTLKMRQSGALKKFLKQSQANNNLTHSQTEGLNRIQKAFKDFLADKFVDDRIANYSSREVLELLSRYGLAETLVQEARTIFKEADRLLYAGYQSEGTQKEQNHLVKRFEDLAEGIEKTCIF